MHCAELFFNCLALFVWCSHALSLSRRTDMHRDGIDSLGPASTSPRERRCARAIPGKALRVIPRGKQRLTVYRAHQVNIARAAEVRFSREASQIKIVACSFGLWKREVPENYIAREWPRPMFRKWAPFSKIVRSLDGFQCFRVSRVLICVSGWGFVHQKLSAWGVGVGNYINRA